MDITRLRTCTFKSKADFYYQSEWTVGKLWQDKPLTLLKIYYQQEKISFSEEVLQAIEEKFPNFFRIEKPGKYEGNWKEVVLESSKKEWTGKTHKELLNAMRGYVMNNKKVPKDLYNCFIAAKAEKTHKKDNMNLQISKKELQAINHGKAARR